MTLKKGDRLRLFPMDDGMSYELTMNPMSSKNDAGETILTFNVKEKERRL